MTTLSLTRLEEAVSMDWNMQDMGNGIRRERHLRPNRVRRNRADSGDILEFACVGDSLDQLLADSLEAAFGYSGHSARDRTVLCD